MAAAAVALAALAACGQDRGGGPQGSPEAVVRQSADTTLRQATAKVFIDGPDGRHSEGTLDPAARTGSLTLTAPGLAPLTIAVGGTGPKPLDKAEYTDPLAVVDLVRHAQDVDPFGGLLVRGAGAVRYDVHIAPPGAPRFFADVYVDKQGRVRRLTVPEDRSDHRVKDSEYRLARLITVDLVYP
jgi:hypothetical protein